MQEKEVTQKQINKHMETNNFPTITLSSQQIAELVDLEIGNTCKIEMTVKLTGKRQAEAYDLPTQDGVDGRTSHNSIVIGTFQIIDAEYDTEEDKKGTYENEYAMNMQPREQTITIKLVK